MPYMPGEIILGPQHLQRIDSAMSQLSSYANEIERASAAGLDVTAHRARHTAAHAALQAIKTTYFSPASSPTD